jgi:hypothetical protein
MQVVREKEGVPPASRYIGRIELQGLLHLLRCRCWIMAVGHRPQAHLCVSVGKGGVERQRTHSRAPHLRTRRRRRHEVIGRLAPRVGQCGPRVGLGRVARDRGFGVRDGGTERGGRELVRLEPRALDQLVRLVAARAARPDSRGGRGRQREVERARNGGDELVLKRELVLVARLSSDHERRRAPSGAVE